MQVSTDAARDLAEALSRTASGATYGIVWAERGIRVAIILGGAWLLTRFSNRVLRQLRRYAMRTMDRHGGISQDDLERRSATIVSVAGKLVATTIWIVAVVMALNELTFNIQPLIAGIGVAGLALGLGAQTLIKDWLGGVFLLLEDQIRIGDAVTINNTVSGVVEEINVRTTVLRAENGALHIVPNGSVTQISNFTRDYAFYMFETVIAHGANADRALEILAQVGAEVIAEERFAPYVLGKLEIYGVDKLTDRGCVIRARLKTLPSKQWAAGREINRRVKERFDAEGIRFPPVS